MLHSKENTLLVSSNHRERIASAIANKTKRMLFFNSVYSLWQVLIESIFELIENNMVYEY